MILNINHKKEVSALKNALGELKYDLKQNLITCCPPPALIDIALLNIATSLWHEQLKKVDFELLKYRTAWEVLESHRNEIIDGVSKLVIPVNCKEFLTNFIYFVVNEIIYYVRSYYIIFHLTTTDKLKALLDNICWTQQGTINYLKTFLKIIEQSDLSIRDRFEIACCCCLEEKIQELLNILPQNDIKEIEDDGIPFSFPSFWKSYITNKELPLLIDGQPAREFLVKFAITNKYETAVAYIWEKFANEELKERITEYAELAGVDFPNCTLYFAKQMTHSQLKEASAKVHCGLLHKLEEISIYCNFLPISHYMLELNRSKNVHHNYEVITYCWVHGILEVKEFLNIWYEFVLHFKSDFESDIVNIYEDYISDYIGSTLRHITVTNFLLEMTSSENRSELIYADRTFKYCADLIIFFGLKEFNLFLNSTIKEDEISNFKEAFLTDKRWILLTNLICKRKYDVLDEIVFEFCANESIKEFKKNFFYDNLVLFSYIEGSSGFEIDLISDFNKYLSWCFDGDEKEMMICRINVFNIDSNLYSANREVCFYHISDLITDRKWKLVEQYWSWLFYSTNEILTTSKEKLERIKKILLKISGELCFLRYMKNTECHNVLKRFIISCFEQNEIMDLKAELQGNNDLSLLIMELLKVDKLLEANNLVNWCYSFDENKIDGFKSTFLNLYGSSLLFEPTEGDVNTDKIKSMIAWFVPSAESENMFDDGFIEYIANKRKAKIKHDELGEENCSMRSAWSICKKMVKKLTLQLLALYDRKRFYF